MNPSNPLPFRTFFLAALAGILSFLPYSSANAQSESPAGDLTVTVEEQENGDVKFTLSGTAFMQGFHPGISSTNFSNSAFPGVPPTYSFGSFGLPNGLTLSAPDNQISGSEDPEEGGTAPLIDHPLNWIYFSAGWQLSGPFTTGPLSPGDPISGSGSVTTSNIDFNQYFVPGTFLVEPGGFFITPDSEPEVAEGASTNQGVYPYFMTYNVIPFTYNPSISLSGPGTFSKTLVRKSGGSQKVKITNSGNASLTNLDLSISGPGSRDFSSTGLSANELAPGESTTVEVSFRPKRKGTRKATLTVKGSYIPRMPLGVASEPEEIPLEDLIESPPVPVEISASTELSGKGIAKPRNKPRPNSPRFPRAR